MVARDTKLIKLHGEINIKREEMIRIANKYGYTNSRTISSSEQLDELLLKYQLLLQREQFSIEITNSFYKVFFFLPK